MSAMVKAVSILVLAANILGCGKKSHSSDPELTQLSVEAASFERNPEAREDSLELVLAYQRMGQIEHELYAVAETEPVASMEGEDAADDPAIWYNVIDPDSSLIFGSNKKGGIYSYHLDGSQVDFYEVGDINNIDVRQNVLIAARRVDLLGGSNRTDNSVVLFEIDNQGKLTSLLKENYRFETNEIGEVYGFCLYQQKGQGYLVVNGKGGAIEVLKITAGPESVQLKPYLSWKLPSQPEGMVVDDENSMLYIGEEEHGIWKVSLEPHAEPEANSQQSEN